MTTELFQNVLVCPLAEDTEAVQLERVMRRVGQPAGVRLLGVWAGPTRLQRMLAGGDHLDELHRQRCDAETERLTELAAAAGLSGVTIDVGEGSVAVTIVEEVVDKGHDLVVVIADSGRSEVTTVKKLLRKCPCPVWVARPTERDALRVLAAVDPEPDDRELNIEILRLAAAVAGAEGSECHVVHAWEMYGEASMRRSAFWNVSAAEIDEMVEAEFVSRAAALGELLADSAVPDLAWSQHLPKGPPVEAVVEVVDRLGIDVLVLGTVGRSGVPGLVMGNTAESLVDEVRCSMVAVKPPGHVSPVDPPEQAGDTDDM